LNAYATATEKPWFDSVSRQGRIDEVNFWTPHPWGGHFGVLERGDPLLFKLKTPFNAIAGGGFFEHYTELPASVAWDLFGGRNGAHTLLDLRQGIERLRRESPRPAEDYVIGCILLVEPFFWPEDRWISDPPGWHPNVRGRTYDLREREGRRLWEEVVYRLQVGGPWGGRSLDGSQLDLPGGYGDPLFRPRRIGEGTFQAVIADVYRRRCAVSGEAALPALEAAVIRPMEESSAHYVRNGILLRADLRKLFNTGYLTISPQYRVRVSSALQQAEPEGHGYSSLHDSEVRIPEKSDLRPDPELLRWHNEHVFRP
jgi:putative restriction endonuclease